MTNARPPMLPPNSPPNRPAGNGLQNWLPILIMAFGLYYLSQTLIGGATEEISYTAFLQQVRSNKVADVTMKSNEIHGHYNVADEARTGRSGYHFKAYAPSVESDRLLEILESHNVTVRAQADKPSLWAQLLIGFLPWLLIIGLFVWSGSMLRDRLGGAGGVAGYNRSKARRFDSAADGPHYSDIAGLDSAKDDLRDIIDYLKHPEKYRAMGARMPKGVLMMGAPGTGKTMLARATAMEAGVPFYSVSGSEFIEMFVGVGASRVRDMFRQAREDAPALIFIDEIDSVGRVRGTGLGGGNDEREQTLNQVLAEMDGFNADEAVVVLAATNRPDVLDPALLRPGRFDRKVTLELPQRRDREAILAVHCRGKPLSEEVNLEDIAAITPGFAGADLANIVNEAALHAAREDRQTITHGDFLQAREKVVMGAPRTDLLNPDERKRIACHEAGHALTAYFSPHSDPVQKISIVPRGQALGMTEQIPQEDRHNLSEAYLRARLSILLGGRCAEKRLFGDTSTGAADDLKQATKLAYKMVGQWGMSRELGPVGYRVSEAHPFLGRELSEPREFSEHTASLLDAEARGALAEAETYTAALLDRHAQQLDSLINALLEKETLQYQEIRQLLGDAGGPR